MQSKYYSWEKYYLVLTSILCIFSGGSYTNSKLNSTASVLELCLSYLYFLYNYIHTQESILDSQCV